VTASFKYKILSLILFPAVLSIAVMNYETWTRSSISAEAVAQPAAGPANPAKAATPAAGEEVKPIQPAEAYGIIAEKNIFNPERKDFPSPALAPAEQPRAAVRPQVVLSGVVISDDYQAAFVSSPGSGILKPGDKIGEYKLARISGDRITLEAGRDSFEVLLYDGKKPKRRVEVKTGIQPAPEHKTAQPAPATPPAVETAKAESNEKPAEPSKEMASPAARPSPGRTPIDYSREARSKRYGEMRGSGNQQNTGIIESTTGNKDRSSDVGKAGAQ
jgi:type II secretory pathway component PulC